MVQTGQCLCYLDKLVSSVMENETENSQHLGMEEGLELILFGHHLIPLALSSDLSFPPEFLLPSTLQSLCFHQLKRHDWLLCVISDIHMGQMGFHEMYEAITGQRLPLTSDWWEFFF